MPDSPIYPADIQAKIGDNEYKLVFLNGCLTADEKEGSAADAFKVAFKTETYIGWTTTVWCWDAARYSIKVFRGLDHKREIGLVINDIRNKGGIGQYLKYLGKPTTTIDLSSN